MSTILIIGVVFLYLCLVYFTPKRILDLTDGSDYLTRYFLFRSPWLNVFLHHIHREDKDRHPHNHPWPWSYSLILRGGYCERRYTTRGVPIGGMNIYSRGSLNNLTEAAYHRIVAVLPNTLTLFVAGRYSARWGFNVNGDHVDAEDYLGPSFKPSRALPKREIPNEVA